MVGSFPRHAIGSSVHGKKPAFAEVGAVDDNSEIGAVLRQRSDRLAGARAGDKRNMRFDVGEIVITPAASDALTANGMTLDDLLTRHQAGDWGDVSAQVREVNERGLLEQFNLQSTYALPDSRRLVVVTNHQRTATTIHLDAK